MVMKLPDLLWSDGRIYTFTIKMVMGTFKEYHLSLVYRQLRMKGTGGVSFDMDNDGDRELGLLM